MRMGRWRGRLDKITEQGWHCVSYKLITQRGLTVGIAALPMFVGAFRSTELAKRNEGREREKEGGRSLNRGKIN